MTIHSLKGSDWEPYTTNDSYTVTPESIIQNDESGILADYSDHVHYAPYED